MRNALLLVITVAVLVPTLSGCDFSSQNIDWKPHGTYSIVGPLTAGGASIDTPVAIPPADTAYFYVEAFTAKKQYQWTIEPTQPSKVIRKGEFLVVTFQDAGTYTITVAASGHQGKTTVAVADTTQGGA